MIELRTKRSLLPFGSILSSLLGVGSESQIDEIREVVNKLGKQQSEISHILEKSLTVVNQTQTQVITNRNKLNEIVKSVQTLIMDIKYTQNKTWQEHTEIYFFIENYHRLSEIISDLEQTMFTSMKYLDDLRTVLDVLSMNTITPSGTIISPIGGFISNVLILLKFVLSSGHKTLNLIRFSVDNAHTPSVMYFAIGNIALVFTLILQIVFRSFTLFKNKIITQNRGTFP